jgi:hypothetical protein
MKKLRYILVAIFLATAVVGGLSLLLPSPGDAEIKEYYSPIATSVVLVDVMLALGSAVLFMVALRRFKPELKNAYRLLALSTVAVGLGLLILPYIEYYGLWDNIWLNMGSYLQYLIGAPLLYAGVRLFYKKLELRGPDSAIWVAVVGVALLAVINPLLPYNQMWPFSTTQYNLFKIVEIIPIVLYLLAGIMVLRILRRVGAEYRAALTWLFVAMVFYVINTVGIALIEIIGYEIPYYEMRIYEVPAILGDLCLVFAGYSFAAIGMPRDARMHGRDVSSIDLVVHIAGMASNQVLIDEYLNRMRAITARLKPGDTLSNEDQAVLKEAYLDIENFLVTEDKLREFDRVSIRRNIAEHFKLHNESNSTFWPSL